MLVTSIFRRHSHTAGDTVFVAAGTRVVNVARHGHGCRTGVVHGERNKSVSAEVPETRRVSQSDARPGTEVNRALLNAECDIWNFGIGIRRSDDSRGGGARFLDTVDEFLHVHWFGQEGQTADQPLV